MTATAGQIARRRFDHDEARARYAAGETIADLARSYGVSYAAVARVVDERVRRRMHAQTADWLERTRMPCRGGCGLLLWTHVNRTTRTGYCQRCLGEKRREENGIQHGTESEYRAGCRCGDCLRAATAAKRRRREQSRVPCSHGCGTMVDSINRRNPDKPPECGPCARKRILVERYA